MMDLYHSHHLDFGKLLLVRLSNCLARHFERALSLVLKKQPPRSVGFLGLRFQLSPVLMAVLTQARTQARQSHHCSSGWAQPSEAVRLVEELPLKEQQLCWE